MVEKILLLHMNIIAEKQATTGLSVQDVRRLMYTDRTYDKIATALLDIVCPEWMFLSRQGCSAEAVGTLFHERWIQLLS